MPHIFARCANQKTYARATISRDCQCACGIAEDSGARTGFFALPEPGPEVRVNPAPPGRSCCAAACSQCTAPAPPGPAGPRCRWNASRVTQAGTHHQEDLDVAERVLLRGGGRRRARRPKSLWARLERGPLSLSAQMTPAGGSGHCGHRLPSHVQV